MKSQDPGRSATLISVRAPRIAAEARSSAALLAGRDVADDERSEIVARR